MGIGKYKVYTWSEYLGMGFTPEEVPAIRMIDWLNLKQHKAGHLTEKEERRYDELVEKLGI